MYMYSFVSFTVQDGISPLHVASQFGRTEIVEILLKGADPNLTTKVWRLVWPLHLLPIFLQIFIKYLNIYFSKPLRLLGDLMLMQ